MTGAVFKMSARLEHTCDIEWRVTTGGYCVDTHDTNYADLTTDKILYSKLPAEAPGSTPWAEVCPVKWRTKRNSDGDGSSHCCEAELVKLQSFNCPLKPQEPLEPQVFQISKSNNVTLKTADLIERTVGSKHDYVHCNDHWQEKRSVYQCDEEVTIFGAKLLEFSGLS